jgi:hypothetical protein
VSRFRLLKLHLTAGLAALLLLAQVGALAHAVKHEADKPDTSCAQCLFANHLSSPPASAPLVVSVGAPEAYALPVSFPAPRKQEFHAYSVRAPPVDFEV